MSKLKKLLALLLTMATLLSTLPVTALAAEAPLTEPEEASISSDELIDEPESLEPEAPAEEAPAEEPEQPVEEVSAEEPEQPVEEVPAEEPEQPAEEVPAEEVSDADAGIAVAAELPEEEDSVGRIAPFAVVNPIYADVFDSSDTSISTAAIDDITVDAGTYASVADAVTAVRAKLKARTTSFSITYTTTTDPDDDSYGTEVTKIVKQAMAHTGKPTEGDYIAYQWSQWGITDDSRYYESGSSYRVTLSFYFVYLSTASQEKAVDTAVTNLRKSLSLSGKTQYEKVKAIYTWMCGNISYDYYHLSSNPDYPTMYTAYGAIVNKTCVCQGYSVLFYRLALEESIDARVISGYADYVSKSNRHAWNIVKLDGKYYNLDATWDAGQSSYSWFLKSPANFDSRHIRHYGEYNGSYYEDDYTSSAFNKKYPMGTTNYQLPATPKLVSVVNANGSVKVTWNAAARATSYNIYRKSGSSGWSRIGTSTSTSYADKSAVSGQTYTYTVRAQSTSALSGYNTTGLSIKYLATPALLSAQNTSKGITVTWSKVAGAASYELYCKAKDSTAGWQKIRSGLTSTSCTLSGGTSGRTYIYTVRAVSGSTRSSFIAAGISVLKLSIPAVTVTNASGGVVVSWNKVAGATGYYVYRKTVNGSYARIKTITSGSTVSVGDTGVKNNNGTAYVYTVRAYNGSTLSSFVGKTIVRLTTPTISSVTNSASSAITVKWNRNTTATGYQVYYKVGTTAKAVTVAGNANLSKVITGLTKGSTYTVYVRSYKTVSGVNYYSGWSASKTVKISK